MASNSGRRSDSSARSRRKRVVIGAAETVRVRYRHDRPEVESERKTGRSTSPADRAARRQPSSNAGKRLSKAKRAEREKRQSQVRTRRTIAGVGLGLVVVALIVGAVALYRAPIFPVKKVEVAGNVRLSDSTVLGLARIPADETLLRLKKGGIERHVLASPWVTDVNVDRDFPSTLRITVTERRPALIVDQGGTALWLVASDGVCLGKRSANTTSSIVLRDAPETKMTPGAKVRSAEVLNAVRVVESLSPELRAQIDSIDAPTIEDTAIHTREDVEIFIGRAVGMREKNRIVDEILGREKGVVYINVRVIERPTWRGLDSGTR